MTKLLLTPEEAAEVLGIGRSKVFELLAAGRLRSVKIGRSRRIAAATLTEFVASLEAEAEY
jgi:excisionase family DNA binding protein